MRHVYKVIRVRDIGKYTLTDAILDDGTEATAYLKKSEKNFETGERVECFFDHKWNQVKFRRTKAQL